MPLDLFAGIHVREAVWELANHRCLFIEQDTDTAGGEDITILVMT